MGLTAKARNKPITVTDTGTVLADHLVAISANTSLTVTATAATTISGSASNLLSVVQDAGIATSSSYAAVITGSANTSQISRIDADTTGAVSVENVADTIGNISSFNVSFADILEAATGTVTANGTNNNDFGDFSTVQRAMVMNGGGGNDSLTGTAFNDLISGGAGLDSLFGGDGNDVFTFLSGEASTAAAASLSYDKIGDFSVVNDKIDLQGMPTFGAAETNTNVNFGGQTGTISINTLGKISFTGAGFANATMSEVLAAVRSIVTGLGETAIFEFNDGLNGNGTFVYQENGASTDDMLVFLAGVTGIEDISRTAGDANTIWIM